MQTKSKSNTIQHDDAIKFLTKLKRSIVTNDILRCIVQFNDEMIQYLPRDAFSALSSISLLESILKRFN